MRRRDHRDWMAAAGLFVAVAVVFVALFFGALRLEEQRTSSEFAAAAAARIRAVGYALQSDLRLLGFTLADFRALMGTRVPALRSFLAIAARELHAFAGELMAEEQDVAILALLLRVPDDARPGFETQARERVEAGFRIYETDADGRPVAAAAGRERYPVLATLPAEDQSLLGFDMSTAPDIREALEAARDRATLIASETAALSPGQAPAVWIAGAIYRTPLPPATVEQRRADLTGFLVLGLRIDRLFAESLAGLYPSGIDLVLSDRTDPAAPRDLAAHESREPASASPSGRPGRLRSLSQAETIRVADRSWLLTATPSRAFFAMRPLWVVWAIPVVGLALATMASLFLRMAVSRRIQVERVVEQRTAELTRQIQDRQTVEAQLKSTEQSLVARLAQLDRSSTDLLLLNRLGEMMQRCSTTEEALQVIAKLGGELFPRDTGTLYRYVESLGVVEREAGWGDAEGAEAAFPVDRCWALRGGTPHFVGDPARDVRCLHLGPDATRASVCLPLAAQGQTIGLLVLAGPRGVQTDGGPPLEERRNLAVTLASQVSPALANIRLREILHEQSVRDALTGLYNRRYMEETIRQTLHRVQRSHAPLCVIMIDIDHFKRYNDQHGHDAGDALLRALGAFLRGELRESDTACRYGGEEFAVIMPDAALDVGRSRAERIRERVRELRVATPAGELSGITLSLGVAVYPENGTDRDTLIGSADRALYRAKSEGRDRVILA